MSDLGDLTPHEDEIFEGLVDSVMGGRFEDFDSLRVEWDRINEAREERGASPLQFAGPPQAIDQVVLCGHCGALQRFEGICFGAKTGWLFLWDHVQTFCPSGTQCRCWSTIERDETSPPWPLCQRCERPQPICECERGVTLGPCADWVEAHLKEKD